jgi:hypothetical protein
MDGIFEAMGDLRSLICNFQGIPGPVCCEVSTMTSTVRDLKVNKNEKMEDLKHTWAPTRKSPRVHVCTRALGLL